MKDEVNLDEASLKDRLNDLKPGLGDGVRDEFDLELEKIEKEIDKSIEKGIDESGKQDKDDMDLKEFEEELNKEGNIQLGDIDKELEDIERGIDEEGIQPSQQVRSAMQEIDAVDQGIKQEAGARIAKGQDDFKTLDAEIKSDIEGIQQERAAQESKLDSAKVDKFAKNDVSFDELDQLSSAELDKLGENMDPNQPKIPMQDQETAPEKSFLDKMMDLVRDVVNVIKDVVNMVFGDSDKEREEKNFAKEVDKAGKGVEDSVSKFEGKMKEFDKQAGLDGQEQGGPDGQELNTKGLDVIVQGMKASMDNPEQSKEEAQEVGKGVGKFTDKVLNEQGSGQSLGR